MPQRTLLLCLVLFSALVLQGCAVGYIARAAYEESKILINRRDIPEVIADPKTSPDERHKLSFVVQAREFARTMGLNPKQSFTKYTRLETDVLTWVVMGSRPDAFQLATWWFPIVGRLPYRGFFDREDAESFARDLNEQGFETWVRGSEAFSTLGWFNDPVVTPSLKAHETRVVNTVIHETVHATLWIPDNVPFNESLANFVGLAGTVQFFEAAKAACALGDSSCHTTQSKFLQIARRTLEQELKLGDTLETLYKELQALYSSDAPLATKLEQRGIIFEKHIAPLRQANPGMTAFKTINNAELMQVIIYVQKLRLFKRILTNCDGRWDCFLAKMQGIKDQLDAASSEKKDAFALLEELTPDQTPLPDQRDLPVSAGLRPSPLA